ncbi:MAG: hypothetical protein ACREQA_06225, partial [Candidatus Binatia bacterium]
MATASLPSSPLAPIIRRVFKNAEQIDPSQYAGLPVHPANLPPVYFADLPDDVMGTTYGQVIILNRKHGFDRLTVVHELEHTRQPIGLRALSKWEERAYTVEQRQRDIDFAQVQQRSGERIAVTGSQPILRTTPTRRISGTASPTIVRLPVSVELPRLPQTPVLPPSLFQTTVLPSSSSPPAVSGMADSVRMLGDITGLDGQTIRDRLRVLTRAIQNQAPEDFQGWFSGLNLMDKAMMLAIMPGQPLLREIWVARQAVPKEEWYTGFVSRPENKKWFEQYMIHGERRGTPEQLAFLDQVDRRAREMVSTGQARTIFEGQSVWAQIQDDLIASTPYMLVPGWLPLRLF